MELGEEVQKLRSDSMYGSRTAFAKEAGISREALRKIEEGISIPERENLESILDVAGPPQNIRDRIMRTRDEAQARRDGLSIPLHGSDSKLKRMADRLVSATEISVGEFFNSASGEVTTLLDSEKDTLRSRFLKVLREEING